MADNEPQSLLLPDLEHSQEIDSMGLTMEEADSGGVVNISGPQQHGEIAKAFRDSDSEDMEELFGGDPVSTTKSASSKGKKKFLQLSDVNDGDIGDTPMPSPTKRPRIVSIFGGPIGEMDETHVTSKTADMGIGVGMTSLSLDHQADESEVHNHIPQQSISPGPNSDLVDGNEPDRPQDLSHEDSSSGQARILSQFGDPDAVKSYDLRKNFNRLGAESTHFDFDQSGDYDPVEESRNRLHRAATAKRTKKSRETKKDNGKNRERSGEGNAMPRSDQVIGFKKIAKLSFKTMGTVLNITDGQDNWPANHSTANSEDEAERQELLSFYRQKSPSSQRASHTRVPDPAGEENDLRGHPAARGCKRCRLQYDQCSMISNGRYPCSSCQDGNLECQPIIEITVSGPCKRCEQYDQPCSFENAEDNVRDSISHGMAARPQATCNECFEAGDLHCKATPPKGYKSDRIDLNEILYSENRDLKDCTHCRALKKRCSLKKTSDKPPCNRCRREKIGCHFYDLTSYESSKLMSSKEQENSNDEEQAAEKVAAKPRPTLLETIAPECSTLDPGFFSAEDIAYMRHEEPSDEEEAEELEPEKPVMMTDTSGRHGRLTKIKTSFAHPMVFSMAPNSDDVQDCNFCEIPVFGMVGHFEREVAVIQWDDGLGYTEIMNGHREDHGSTTMCGPCIYHRLQILMCPSHFLKRIMTKDELDFNTAAEDLITTEGQTAAMQQQLQRWCSMCFSLATHMCCTSQPPVSACEEGNDQAELEGCGLRLCDECAHKLDRVYEYSLDTMATVFDEVSKPKEGDDDDDDEETPTKSNEQSSVRADVGLLTTKGLLMKCVESMASVAE